PYAPMDLCLYATDHGMTPAEVAPLLDLTEAQVERVFRDIQAKRRTTRCLHAPPALLKPVVSGDSSWLH
ncbi:MAG TPA: hypothetical protein VLQ88_06200, partial [Chromatiaceae bacterium]|nr:hypothetical protein [Chromatiaceae bacterium]